MAGLVQRPRLFALLDRGAQAPVTLLSAPAGSGKTMLLSSWLRQGERSEALAWVGVERGESDATHFWGMVIDALRDSGALPPDDPLATLAPAPQAEQDEFVQHLLAGLARLEETVLLVLDDVHNLRSDDALRGIDELVRRAPPNLRLFMVSRRDPKLALHRLRLAGELVEIRAADLEFSAEEAGELMSTSGVTVDEADLAKLHRRTEGWAAGLRLAAMSLTGHADPARFVAEFSGSERTVADYLLGEVLASQPREVRELLLRTCILERVNGPLADVMTGREDGTRLLAEMEEANAFVVAVDASRSWFRYHHLLADLLRLELRREAPQDVPGLHRSAAGWYADNGHVVDAIRHAELGEDWEHATELLGRHWVHLVLDGQETTLASLLAGLPADLANSDAEVAAIAVAARLAEARWAEADVLLAAARRTVDAVPEHRRRRARIALATVELLRARRLGDLESVVEDAGAVVRDEVGPGGPELQALALMNLGIAESWTLRLADSERHLNAGLALGRQLGRPYVEVGCLGALGVVANITGRLDEAEESLRRSVAIADRVGWSTHPIVGPPLMALALVCIDRGRNEEGARWMERATAIMAHAPEPAAAVGLLHTRGMLAWSRREFEQALACFRECERVASELRVPHFLGRRAFFWQLRARLRLGDLEPVRAALADVGAAAGGDAEWCNIAAHICLAGGDPEAAVAAVAPVLAGEAIPFHVNIEIESLLLDALARHEVGDPEGERSVERVLELTEPQGRVWMALSLPGIGELLEAYPVHRTAHAAHLKNLIDLAAGGVPEAPAAPAEPADALSERELAVLRFLPTNLSAGDIGAELFVSVHTVKTHMRKLYAKLDVHTRAEAVQRGRALGLLGPARRGA